MKKKIVNTNVRKEFILNKLIPIVERFENETKINLSDAFGNHQYILWKNKRRRRSITTARHTKI